ncbi:MAG: SigB/SigF/SigG family RNA polymerase sigma factor [Firmicutes bacterium]|nr:SigB/SigF/SigG family RNA polymerase sigma factor [Bacillota bacterium]
MARHKVEISGVNTANIKTLSFEEMEELFKRMKEGDLYAREELVNGNLKLVLALLKDFNKKNENMDDLFQIGCVGLLKAIDNFDLSYGVKFSTYCVPMIQGEIRRYLRDNSSLRISRSVKDLSYKIMKVKDEYLITHGKEPTVEYLSNVLDTDESDIINAIESMKDPVSIFEAIYNDGGDTIYLCDQIEDKKNNNDLDIRMAVENAIFNLEEREKYILDQRFIIGKTQMEIASELGISQAQISRIEKSSISKIKNNLNH